jgi:glyoxylase-like metal-dependent hydrolase (beta-lactamase superfamily II)
MPGTSRREYVIQTAAMFLSGTLRRFAHAQSARPKTRLILLGTAGGPRPRKTRVPSSQVILVNDAAYVFDCGVGVATQLARADVPLSSLRHVFITHHRSDHNAEYGADRLGSRTANSCKYVGAATVSADDGIVSPDE